MSKNHRLFKHYPLNGMATVSTGQVPTPYHIYGGYGVFIGGTVDLAAARQLLRQETVAPIEAGDGRTSMGIWISNFTDASLGPHHELQFSFFVGGQQGQRIGSHPLGLLALMSSPEARMMCHGLWNNTPTVVAYNRELLSLNACLASSAIEYDAGTLDFRFQDGSSRQPLLSGKLRQLDRVSLRTNWDVMAQVGFRRIRTYAQQPWVRLQILNPMGVVFTRNAVAESFTK
jgi:hypothetical protein